MLCRLDRVIYQAANGFGIYSYSTKDESVPQSARRAGYYSDNRIRFSAVGYHLPTTDTVEVELKGKWQQSKYGLQLEVEHFEQVMPTDRSGIIAYLSSGFIKGIGPETAKAIVARFGDRALDVLENDPQQLLQVKGIARAKLKKIVTSYQATRCVRELATYLAHYDVTERKIMKIHEEFGDSALSIVKSDPFQLCKISGFGFLTVDAIARKTKVSLRNPLRYLGAINFVLEEGMNAGHLFIPRGELVSKCHDLLNRDCDEEVVSADDIQGAITRAHQEKIIYVERERVYQTFERLCEVKTANGDVGVITAIKTDEDGEMEINVKLFDGREITYTEEMLEHVDWSYCLTIHKAQGSEYPTVIMPLLKEHYVMLRRNLFYTGISRAQSKVVIIGQRQAVFAAIHRNDVDKRNTVLADRIVAYYDREIQRRAV